MVILVRKYLGYQRIKGGIRSKFSVCCDLHPTRGTFFVVLAQRSVDAFLAEPMQTRGGGSEGDKLQTNGTREEIRHLASIHFDLLGVVFLGRKWTALLFVQR